MREFSVPLAATIDDAASLTDMVWDNAELAPDRVQFARRPPAVPGDRGGRQAPGRAWRPPRSPEDASGREDETSGWQEVACRQFRDEVVGVARGLVAAGIAPGTRVGLMSSTRYEWTLLDYAIWACGAETVPIYETSSAEQAEQVEWILADSESVACVVETGSHEEIVASVRERLPNLAHVWQIENRAIETLVEGGATTDPAEIERCRRAVRADDLATIIYTSGTTGRPKGCMLTHRNIYTDIANAVPGLPHLFGEGASTLLFLPLAHAFARLIQVGVVFTGTRMGHTAEVKNLVDELQQFRPTFVLAVPRVFEKVHDGARRRAYAQGKSGVFERAERVAIAYSEALDAKDRPGLALRLRHKLFDRLVYRRLRAALGGRCTAAISGGAPLGTRLAHFLCGIGVTVFEGYGLTETSPAVAVNVEDSVRIGTVGRPLPGVTIRIVDEPDSGNNEILIKGDVVFPGYWRNPQATAEAIDRNGWFHSGDLGELDDDGFLKITGRTKEIIVTAGGKNIAPAEPEDRLRAHPLISQAMLVGDRQPFIAALITIDEEAWPDWLNRHGKPANATLAELRGDPDLNAEIQRAVDEVNRTVSRAEAIKKFRILPDDFTRANGMLTPTLKVKRNLVQKEYADEIADIYRS